MSEIYEELYERLINEGIDDSTATAVVNRMYEAEELHDVEVLDEVSSKQQLPLVS